jgi:hypothetical protein
MRHEESMKKNNGNCEFKYTLHFRMLIILTKCCFITQVFHSFTIFLQQFVMWLLDIAPTNCSATSGCGEL